MRTRTPLRIATALVAVAVVTSCGGTAERRVAPSSVLAASTSEAPGDLRDVRTSAYCEVVAPAPHRIEAGDAAVWSRRVRADFAVLWVAPPEVAADWAVVSHFSRNLRPAFDGSTPTPWPHEPPDVRAARARIAAFEATECS